MMRQALWSSTIVVLLGVASFAHAADAPPARVLDDIAWTDAAAWETSGGVSVKDGVLHSPGDGGSAALDHRLPVAADATLAMAAAVDGGSLAVQVEWFDAKGAFLRADPVTVDAGAAPLPAPPANARSFRLKHWLTGAGATATITQLRLTAPLAWRTAGAQLEHTWKPDGDREDDKAMVCTPGETSLHLKLADGAGYAGAALLSRAALPADGVVMLDLQTIRGGRAAMQLLCYDDKAAYLGAVDLLKGVDVAKTYEVALSLVASKLPANTKLAAVKLWLEGEGATARVGGVHLAARGAR